MNGRPWRLAAIALAALLVACDAAPAPTASQPRAPSGPLADVLTYKVDNERTGIMPGPALVNEPKILWEVGLESGSAASPLVHDGEVIIFARDGRIAALNPETGHENWSKELDSGIAWTPTISDGILYVVTEDGVLHAIRLDDRADLWRAEGFLAETIVTVAGELVLVGAPGEVVALSVDDGEKQWRQKTGGSDRVATDGSVAYAAGDGSGTLTALAVDDGEKQWQRDLDSARVLTPVMVEGGLVAATRDSPGGHNFVVGLSADNTERWRWEPFERGRIAAFTVDADRVFVASDVEDTTVQAIDIRTSDKVWEKRLKWQLQMNPVVAGESLYTGGRGVGIVALDTLSGDIRWELPFEGFEGGGMVLTGGLLIAAIQLEGGGGKVIALADPEDPRHAARGSAPSTSEPSATPALSLPLDVLSETVIPGESLPLGAAVAPDGTMYAADQLNNRIVIRHPDGELEYWGEHGTGESQFDFGVVTENDASTSIGMSPDGELIAVGDGNNHRVQVFDGSRKHLTSIGRLGRGKGQFVNPCCVTVDADHRIWVADPARADVQVFDGDGTHLGTFGGLGSGDGQLSQPSIPFVDLSTDEVYVPDFGNRRVSVFSTDGTWLRHYDRKLNDDLRFDYVNLVAVDRGGRLFVIDTTSRLFVIDRDGTLLHRFDMTGSELGDIEPGPFVLQGEGRIYLVDISGTTDARLIVGQLRAPLWPPPSP